MPRPALPCLLLFGLLLVWCSEVAAKPILAPGKVTAVTVYQGQALVTRVVEFDAEDELAEVVVTDLPQQVSPASLYAEPLSSERGAESEIRSVRYRVRPVAQDTRKEVRELDEQIEAVRDQLAANAKRSQLLASQTAYLNKLEGFTTHSADRELQSGVLNAGTLKDLTALVFERRQAIAEEELKLAVQKRELDRALGKLNAERNTLTNGSSRVLREAVVFVDAKQPGPQRLRLTYLVSGATWSPSYNLRAAAERDTITVEYNASVQQLSGEDWSNVAMTLSTASPSLVATAPELNPLPVRLAALAPQQVSGKMLSSLNGRAYFQARDELFRRQSELSKTRNAGRFGAAFDANAPASIPQSAMPGGGVGGFGAALRLDDSLRSSDLGLNDLANKLQILDLNCAVDVLPTEPKPGNGEGISVVYRLSGRTSLPSRSDQQLIKIAALPLDGEFYRLARPVLTSYVYEEARVTNNTDMVLLAGPAATFVGDRYVGRGSVPTVAVGEPFTIGLGIDESLRVERELVDRDQRVQGGNRLLRFDYRLTLENFGREPVDVRVYDRLPVTAGDQADEQITVSLVTATPAVEGAEPDDDGLLRWDVTAPARGDAAGSTSVDYSVQVEFDRNRKIDLAMKTR